MSEILDGVIAISMVCDMIESFRKMGINITVDDLDSEMDKRDAARQDVNDQLGID